MFASAGGVRRARRPRLYRPTPAPRPRLHRSVVSPAARPGADRRPGVLLAVSRYSPFSRCLRTDAAPVSDTVPDRAGEGAALLKRPDDHCDLLRGRVPECRVVQRPLPPPCRAFPTGLPGARASASAGPALLCAWLLPHHVRRPPPADLVNVATFEKRPTGRLHDNCGAGRGAFPGGTWR